MAPTSLIILAILVVDMESAVETKTEVLDSVNLETNSVGPADTYNIFKEMMEIKEHLLYNSTHPLRFLTNPPLEEAKQKKKDSR